MSCQGIGTNRANTLTCLIVIAPILLITSIVLIVLGAMGGQLGIPPTGCEIMVAAGVLPILIMVSFVCPCFRPICL